MTDEEVLSELRVQGARRPLAVGTDEPQLSWEITAEPPHQPTAFRVFVASDPAALEPGQAHWEAELTGGDTPTVQYAGPDLAAETRYHWAIEAFDETGRVARAESWWETGPETWPGEWIADPDADDGLDGGDASPAPCFRTEFAADPDAVERARLYVCTAGFHDPSLNGESLGDAVPDPATTDFEERVLYAAFDVTDAIEDENALAVVCGRGRYAEATESVWRWHEAPWHADGAHLQVQLRLDRTDGTTRRIVSGDDWRVGHGGTRFDSLYEGEVFDARAEPADWRTPEFDASDWARAERTTGPAGDPSPQVVQPISVRRRFAPESVERVDDDTYVFDAGEMVAGWAELAVTGEVGREIELTYGERLRDDGTVEHRDIHRNERVREFVQGRYQTDTYVCAGTGRETWTPRFSYRGFRYVQVRGYPGEPTVDDLTVEVAHTAVDTSDSDFRCGDEFLERVRGNCRRAMLNNFHGLPTDTPMYEKNGWTGDALTSAEAALYEFDSARFYRKWLRDVADGQRESGAIPRIVPSPGWAYPEGGFPDSQRPPGPVWDAAYPYIAWWLYRYRGDRATLAAHYDGTKALFGFHESRADGDVVRTGHGDHLAPLRGRDENTPEGPAICSTAYYYAMANVLRRAAAVLGREDDADRFAATRNRIASAFDDEFFDGTDSYSTGEFDGYRQTSNVLPLSLGLVPDEREDAILDRLVTEIRTTHDGHLDTGVVGTKHLFQTLTERGHVDLAHEIATQRTYPSYGYWIDRGATSLYESWEHHSRSRDHHMFASVDDWLFGSLAGVRPATPGFDTVRVKPYLPTELDSAGADVPTPHGTVSADWQRDTETVRLSVSLPTGTSGRVHVPGDSDTVCIDGPASDEAAVRPVSDGRPVYAVGAGQWTFAFRPTVVGDSSE